MCLVCVSGVWMCMKVIFYMLLGYIKVCEGSVKAVLNRCLMLLRSSFEQTGNVPNIFIFV